MFLALQSTAEDTAGYSSPQQDALPQNPDFMTYHGTKITVVPPYNHHDPLRSSNETGWSVEKMASNSGSAADSEKGENNPLLWLVAKALFSVLILLMLVKVSSPFLYFCFFLSL